VPEKTQLFRIVRVSGGGRRGGSRAPTPLVGRGEELDILTRRWERARRGEGQLALIVGEPGLGKSRLIEEFRARLAETPHTWVEWASSQLLQNTPLHPVTEWGRARFGGVEVAGEKRLAELEAALASVGLDAVEYSALLAPVIDAPLPLERIPKLSPEELRSRQLAALAAWVLAGARTQPMVLAFEDLHWADPTSLDVLQALAERGAQAPLLIVATTRPEFRPPWKLRSHQGVISLAPLDAGEVARMVGEIATRHALSKDVIAGVSERTGGVPLFVEEVTRLLLERGEAVGVQAIPPTLQQSLAARLDRLGSAREIAQIGAVLGRGFSHALLQAVAGLDEPALRAALDRLADAELLFVEGVAPHANYRFKHALLQDAAYDSLLKSRRQALHRRAAEVLLNSPALEAEALAHHFTQAGQTELAIEWWGKAGQRSMARYALVEGAEQLKRALDQIATLPATPALRREEIKLRVAFANALTLAGDLVGGKEHYDRALAIYDPAEHRPITTRSGRDVGVTLLSFRSSCMWQLGYPAASRHDAERAVKNARETGHATTLMYALHFASVSHIFCGNYAAANAQVDELISSADERGAQYWKALETAMQGDIFALTGKASDAVRAITWGITSLRSIGASLYEPRHLLHLAMAYAELGQPDDARRCIDDAIDKVERSKEKWCEAEVHRIAGEIALKSPAPDTERAEKHFERALRVARQQQAKSWELRAAMSLARLLRDQGKPEQARELLAPVYGWFTEGFDTLDLQEAKALLAQLAS
jgi:predicted ATPase